MEATIRAWQNCAAPHTYAFALQIELINVLIYSAYIVLMHTFQGPAALRTQYGGNNKGLVKLWSPHTRLFYSSRANFCPNLQCRHTYWCTLFKGLLIWVHNRSNNTGLVKLWSLCPTSFSIQIVLFFVMFDSAHICFLSLFTVHTC
jgi:hypothetical protein